MFSVIPFSPLFPLVLRTLSSSKVGHLMYERSKDKDKKGPGESFSLSAVSRHFPQVFAAPNSRNLGLCAFSTIIQSTRHKMKL